MSSKSLSDRARFLLWLVDQHTEKDWDTGKLERFFVPSHKPIFYRDNGKQSDTYVSGSGDASAFKGLERRGLIRRPKTTLPNEYVYELTEDGLKTVLDLELRERFS